MAIILLPSCALSPTRVGTALVSDVQEPENTARFVTKYNSYTKTGKSYRPYGENQDQWKLETEFVQQSKEE